MEKSKMLMKIQIEPHKRVSAENDILYEGRFIGYIDNVMLRLITSKADAVRRIYTMGTTNLENLIDAGKTIKDKRLVFALRQKNNKIIYDTLFITEIIEQVSHISHIHTSVGTTKKDSTGADIHETRIEKVKINCLGVNKTKFILTEFYTF